MKLSQATWEKLLNRWSDIQDCGEKRLLCAVIAQAIADESAKASAFSGFFWTNGFVAYCRVLGLNHQFVIEQAKRARDFCVAA